MDWKHFEPLIDRALAEDLEWGDVTTDSLVPCGLSGKAYIVVKSSGVLAGTEIASMVFHRVDSALHFEILIRDGSRVKSGDIIARIGGSVTSILKGERTAINFMQRLSGIASATRGYADELTDLNTRILDTRKTTAGMRLLEKYAVRMGGGYNHRYSLADGVLIKDNHIAALRSQGMSLKEIVTEAKRKIPHRFKIEVEVSSAREAVEAAGAGADIILLDNMKVDEMRHAVELVAGRALLEASGGITMDNVHKVAETGVDFISIGALTHSVKALDISLEMEN